MPVITDALNKVGFYAQEYARIKPWTNVYGLARTLIAGSTAGTLLVNPSSWLFYPGVSCEGRSHLGLLCVIPHHNTSGRFLLVAILLVVASGWRPRYTGVLHWWTTFSFWSATHMSEGGDLIAMNLALLFIPITITDPRKWHWTPLTAAQFASAGTKPTLLAKSALVVIRCQVAYIYFQSAVDKLDVSTWVDGTGLYYWIEQPLIGAPLWIRHGMNALLLNGTFVTILTWGVIFCEILLFMGLVMPRRYWLPLLVIGLCLHAAIEIIFGLLSFSIIMCGALLLYVYPTECGLSFERVFGRHRSHSKGDVKSIHGPISDSAVPNAVRASEI